MKGEMRITGTGPCDSRGGYNRESSERHDACINGRVAFEVEHSSMQGLKKRENPLVLCSLIRNFACGNKIIRL